jgi:predicted ribonuclease YlaK
MYFYSVEESAEYTKKSVSSIKRFLAELKKNNPKQYENSELIKLEPLNTGHKKIYIAKNLLDEKFNSSHKEMNNSKSNTTNDSSMVAVELLKETIEILKKELEVKNGQIEALNERLRESNTIAVENTRNNTKMLLEDVKPIKKRWWSK